MSNGAATAVEVAEVLESVQCASKETKVTATSVRMHLRVLKRLSMAVADQANPVHEKSGLWYLEKCQEIWGRKTPQTALNGSVRQLDAFAAACVDSNELQMGCEAHFYLALRGNVTKLSDRTVGVYARACVLTMKARAQKI